MEIGTSTLDIGTWILAIGTWILEIGDRHMTRPPGPPYTVLYILGSFDNSFNASVVKLSCSATVGDRSGIRYTES